MKALARVRGVHNKPVHGIVAERLESRDKNTMSRPEMKSSKLVIAALLVGLSFWFIVLPFFLAFLELA